MPRDAKIWQDMARKSSVFCSENRLSEGTPWKPCPEEGPKAQHLGEKATSQSGRTISTSLLRLFYTFFFKNILKSMTAHPSAQLSIIFPWALNATLQAVGLADMYNVKEVDGDGGGLEKSNTEEIPPHPPWAIATFACKSTISIMFIKPCLKDISLNPWPLIQVHNSASFFLGHWTQLFSPFFQSA